MQGYELSEEERGAQGILYNSDERFNYVTGSICDMSSGYLYKEEEKELVPCYVISMARGNLAVYFDIYTAELLGFNNFSEGRGASYAN